MNFLQLFESYLHSHQPSGNPNTLYSPIRYINDLGGKRIRPILLLMAYHMWHEDVAPALPAALAIEYFHNFTLMHDDIMDEAPLRRGQESVHKHFDRNSAILSGDAMLIKSFELLLQAEQQLNPASSVTMIMAKTAIEICEGQQMDIDFETKTAPSESEYLEMIRKKTACLIGASLRIGALLAGAHVEEADKLYCFGENIGLAFQIRDDLLDTFGASELTGKQQSGDILQGKKNFLYVRAFHLLPKHENESFSKAYMKATEGKNLVDILNLYKSLDISTLADDLQKNYLLEAMENLKDFTVDTFSLKSFTEDLMERKN